MQKWAWLERNVGVVKKFRVCFARDYVYGPLNLQHVPTPMRPQTQRGRGHVIAMLSCIPI